MSEKTFIPSPGKIRPGQLITSFGPGSLVQTKYDSVLIMGIDFWFNTSNYVIKNHAYLEKITKRNSFRMPRQKNNAAQNIACTSFPKWGVCVYCSRLQEHSGIPVRNKKHSCIDGHSELLPARLVVTCKRGHLDDFPWVEWAHSNRDNPRPICSEKPKLKWFGGKTSSTITSYVIKCEDCGASNSLLGYNDRNGIEIYDADTDRFVRYRCKGQMPWLKQEEGCFSVIDGEKDKTEPSIVIGIAARSTSLYYPKITRGIIIPELAHTIAAFLSSKEGKKTLTDYRNIKPDITDEEIAVALAKNEPKFIERGYDSKLIENFIKLMKDRQKIIVENEIDLRQIEYDDLKRNETEYRIDPNEPAPEIKINDVSLDSEHEKIFECIRQIPILTSVEVLRYFSRINPPDIDPNDNNICKIQITNGKTKYGDHIKTKDWLPCVVKKGEGIFMVFKKEFLQKYLESREIKSRLSNMIQNHNDWLKISGRNTELKIDAQFILLHSISHILIKQLGFNSGYSEASISERIYSNENMHGLLIYTTSTGDGSMGGLVKQKNLVQLISEGLKNKEICSRDPICISEDPKISREMNLPIYLRQNGSACFGCMMLPETSCEFFNRMLDRKILVNKEFGIMGEFE